MQSLKYARASYLASHIIHTVCSKPNNDMTDMSSFIHAMHIVILVS